MIDSHCHLDFTQFDSDRSSVVSQCEQLGIKGILIPGVAAAKWQQQLTLCQSSSCLFPALGLHPYFLNDYSPEDITQLSNLMSQHPVVGVGEIGLDFAIDVDESLQIQVFEQQLKIAADFDLPVILHHRKSHNQLIRILKKRVRVKGGMVHGFTGSLKQTEEYTRLGFKLGVGGSITYARAQKTRETLAQVPLEHLLLETDAPDMPLNGFQGQRNSPVQLPVIAQVLADLHQLPLSRVKEQTTLNFYQTFPLALEG